MVDKKFVSPIVSFFALMSALLSSAGAQTLPEECVQVPERTLVCPNLLYKKSPIDVPMINVQKGQIVCICMADFSDIRIPAESQLEIVDQKVTIARLAVKVNLSEQDLLTLIRE